MSRRIGEQFFAALQQRDVAAVRALLASGRLSADVLTDKEGRSAVRLAVEAGDADLLQALIDGKCDVNVSLFPPPIRLAVVGGRVDLVRMLLRAGAVPFREGGEDLFHNNGRTVGNNDLHAFALHAPADFSPDATREMVQLLLAAGADPQQLNNEKYMQTPLDIALNRGNKALIFALLAAAPDREWTDQTLAHIEHHADVETLRVLLARCNLPSRAWPQFFDTWQRVPAHLLVLLGGPADVLDSLRSQIVHQVDSHAHHQARALIIAAGLATPTMLQRWSFDCLPDEVAVEAAQRLLDRERLVQTRERFLTVCVALQSLQLPAIQTCEILDAVDGREIALHHRWRVATIVKHFKTSL